MRPGRTFKDGPGDWARVRVVDLEMRHGEGFRDEHGFRYRVVLAFDTGLLPETEGRAYLAPSAKDVAAGAIFSLAHRQADNHWFLRQDWLRQWIDELFRELYPKLNAEQIETDVKRTPEEPMGRYLGFIGLLHESGILPPVKLVGDAERPGRGAIDVDLVLDVGNSRTCGMLIESTGDGPANLNDSYELALRDLTNPERVYAKPFEVAHGVRAGDLRQEPPLAPGRAYRRLHLADSGAHRAGSDAAGLAPARHRGQHRHVLAQALSLGHRAAAPRMAVQQLGLRRAVDAGRQQRAAGAAGQYARRGAAPPAAG